MFLAHINMCFHKFNLPLWKLRLQKIFGSFIRPSNPVCAFNKTEIKLSLNPNLCMLHKSLTSTTEKTY